MSPDITTEELYIFINSCSRNLLKKLVYSNVDSILN